MAAISDAWEMHTFLRACLRLKDSTISELDTGDFPSAISRLSVLVCPEALADVRTLIDLMSRSRSSSTEHDRAPCSCPTGLTLTLRWVTPPGLASFRSSTNSTISEHPEEPIPFEPSCSRTSTFIWRGGRATADAFQVRTSRCLQVGDQRSSFPGSRTGITESSRRAAWRRTRLVLGFWPNGDEEAGVGRRRVGTGRGRVQVGESGS
uniref:Uncharacterized protein n=1 Tax=Arundo donax TaxID=35708 RepID=A0A0A9D141_ARUDO